MENQTALEKWARQRWIPLLVAVIAVSGWAGGCNRSGTVPAGGPGAGGGSQLDGAPTEKVDETADSDLSQPAIDDAAAADTSMASADQPVPSPEDAAPVVWFDEQHHLMWETTPDHTARGPSLAGAQRCSDLQLAGADDWRVPTLDELRTLVQNIAPALPDGACPTGEDCADSDECNRDQPGCLGCLSDDTELLAETDCQLTNDDFEAGRCYWPEVLGGPCGPYWSSTLDSHPLSMGMALYYLRFDNGIIRSIPGSLAAHWVRCVRNP
jgi:hypothetical protein